MKKRQIIYILTVIFIVGGTLIYFYLNHNGSDNHRANIKKENPNRDEYNVPEPLSRFDEEYDVIVIGGEPEGVAAAVSAARNGAKTLLIEKRKELGGLFTYGMLNFLDIPQGADGKSVSRGIFEEWHRMVGSGSAFDIFEAKKAFKALVDGEENLTLTTETEVLQAVVTNKTVEGVLIRNRYGEFEIAGKKFIDATQDADFAVMAGAPHFLGGEDIGLKNRKMAVTLIMHLKDLNWEKIKQTAKSETFGYAEVTDQAAWGFSKLHYVYKPVEENTRLRGLNLAKVGDQYFINALQIFHVNGLDERSKKEAIEKGKRETEHILTFLNHEFPGFEDAEIASFPTELYIRETRHIVSEYQLPMSDVWTNRNHWDAIGYGAYPVDIQAQTPQDYGYIVANPKQYAIPFRSLIPKQIEELLVVGRSSGYSSLAAGSARIVPTGMTTGEAAGVAAALAVEKNLTFREMSKKEELIHLLQSKLEEQHAYRIPTDNSYPYEGEWFDKSIQFLINYGLVFGRYDNDLQVDETASLLSFIQMLNAGFPRIKASIPEEINTRVYDVYENSKNESNRSVTRDEAAQILTTVLFGHEKGNPSVNHWDLLLNEGVIDKKIAQYISSDGPLTRKEIFAINASVLEWMKSHFRSLDENG